MVRVGQDECVIYQNWSEETEFFESEIIFKVMLSETILSRNEVGGQVLVSGFLKGKILNTFS